MSASFHQRRGFTVLELLIVVMILGLLAVVVLPTISKSVDSRRYREAARNVSSFIARAQVRALEADAPKGFMIQPLAADPEASIELFFADTPPPYCGESTEACVAIEDPGARPNVGSLALQFVLPGGLPDLITEEKVRTPGFCRPGDAIRFNASGADYRFVPAPGGASPHRVTMWLDDSQTAGNTPWPRGERVPFRIHRQPSRASTGVLQLQRGAAIDIAWSCIGVRPLSDPTVGLQDRIVQDIRQPLSLLFDASGKPKLLVHSGGMRTVVGEPVFLLIGSSELAGNLYQAGSVGETPKDDSSGMRGANWQYSDAVWLSIDNHTGAMKFALVAPNSATVFQSQRFARLTIPLGAAER